MRKLTNLSLKELNRLRRAGLLGVLLLIVITPILSVSLGTSRLLRVWVIGGSSIVGGIIVLYICLSIHYLLFRKE
jgi:hypothetical protein